MVVHHEAMPYVEHARLGDPEPVIKISGDGLRVAAIHLQPQTAPLLLARPLLDGLQQRCPDALSLVAWIHVQLVEFAAHAVAHCVGESHGCLAASCNPPGVIRVVELRTYAIGSVAV